MKKLFSFLFFSLLMCSPCMAGDGGEGGDGSDDGDGNTEVPMSQSSSGNGHNRGQMELQNLSVQAVSTMTGNVVATGQIVAVNASLLLPASVWPNGTYLMSVINGGTIIKTVQLMK